MFQAEIFAILKAIDATASGSISDSGPYVILIFKHAVLMAITSVWWKSQSLRECKAPVRPFGPYSILLYWVPGHSGILGNETADNLTRLGF